MPKPTTLKDATLDRDALAADPNVILRKREPSDRFALFFELAVFTNARDKMVTHIRLVLHGNNFDSYRRNAGNRQGRWASRTYSSTEETLSAVEQLIANYISNTAGRMIYMVGEPTLVELPLTTADDQIRYHCVNAVDAVRDAVSDELDKTDSRLSLKTTSDDLDN